MVLLNCISSAHILTNQMNASNGFNFSLIVELDKCLHFCLKIGRTVNWSNICFFGTTPLLCPVYIAPSPPTPLATVKVNFNLNHIKEKEKPTCLRATVTAMLGARLEFLLSFSSSCRRWSRSKISFFIFIM